MSRDWSKIVRLHGQMVFRTAFRILGNATDAEDVVQDVLAEAFRLPTSVKVDSWGAWLRKVAVFRALDRRRQRLPSVSLNGDALASSDLSPDDEAIRRELAENLRNLIAALPEREGTVFALRYFEELSNREIADVLGISPGAVAAAVHKVRAKMTAVVNSAHVGDSQ